MNTLLLFFALPIATIILAFVIEKILRCPILTGLTFFAIYLIVTFAVFNISFLVFAVVYVILAFVTAYIAECIYSKCFRNIFCCPKNSCSCVCCNRMATYNSNINNTANAINTNDIASVNTIENNTCNCGYNQNNNTNNMCSCGCNQNNNNVATVNVRDNQGRSTWCCYRR